MGQIATIKYALAFSVVNEEIHSCKELCKKQADISFLRTLNKKNPRKSILGSFQNAALFDDEKEAILLAREMSATYCSVSVVAVSYYSTKK